jgi:Translation initiation factor 2 (IF-2; GTPase)
LREQGEDESKVKELEEELEAHKLYVREMVDINHDDSIIHLIVKAQDKGTLETLIEQINKVAATQQDFMINILSTSVGNVTENEIRDAKHFKATILGMDIKCPSELETLARMEKIPIKTFKLIYDVLDEIKALAQRGGVGKPIEEIIVKGAANIKQVFEVKVKNGNFQ